MLVSHAKQFIFIKTRKTAGTSIEGLLEPFAAPDGLVQAHQRSFLETEAGIIGTRATAASGDEPLTAHSSAHQIKAYIGEQKFRRYEKIVSVRNPFDKVLSWFWYIAPSHIHDELEADFDKTKWLFQNWLLMRPVLPIDRQFYRIKNTTIKTTNIHYETLHDDIMALSDKLDLNIDIKDLPNWKTGTRRFKGAPLSDYYTPETADIVRNKFNYDFEAFGYDRDVPN